MPYMKSVCADIQYTQIWYIRQADQVNMPSRSQKTKHTQKSWSEEEKPGLQCRTSHCLLGWVSTVALKKKSMSCTWLAFSCRPNMLNWSEGLYSLCWPQVLMQASCVYSVNGIILLCLHSTSGLRGFRIFFSPCFFVRRKKVCSSQES